MRRRVAQLRRVEQDRKGWPAYLWLRVITMGILVGTGILLLRVSGGFPPTAWVFLFRVIPVVPYLWHLRGPAILLPLGGLAALSGTLAIGWAVLLRLGWVMVQSVKQNQRGGLLPMTMQTPLLNEHAAEVCMPRLAYLEDEQGKSVVTEEEGNDTYSPINVSSVPIHVSDRHPSPEGTQKPVLVPTYTEVHSPLEVGSCIHLAQNQSWNEDRLFLTQGHLVTDARTLPYALFLVVDGTGGHHLTGHDACEMAIGAVVDHILPKVTQAESCRDEWNEQTVRTMVMESVQAANRTLFQSNQENDAYMEVSMAVCFVVDTTAYVANIGETRAYLYRQSVGLRSMTQESIKETEIHYLGEQAQVDVHPCMLSLQPGDTVLLCTDGLWKVLPALDREEVINTSVSNPTHMSKRLIQAALEGGSQDHIGVVITQLNMAAVKAETPEKDSHLKV